MNLTTIVASPGELVAVKIVPLNAAAAHAETEHKKVMKEFRIHETLKHRNILEVIAGVACERDGVWPEGLYIVMQLGELVLCRQECVGA